MLRFFVVSAKSHTCSKIHVNQMTPNFYQGWSMHQEPPPPIFSLSLQLLDVQSCVKAWHSVRASPPLQSQPCQYWLHIAVLIVILTDFAIIYHLGIISLRSTLRALTPCLTATANTRGRCTCIISQHTPPCLSLRCSNATTCRHFSRSLVATTSFICVCQVPKAWSASGRRNFR